MSGQISSAAAAQFAQAVLSLLADPDRRARLGRAARDLARKTGQSHAAINAELNRQAGIRRITEATIAQLETRLHQADRWLARL